MTREELIEKIRIANVEDTRLFHEIIKDGVNAGFWTQKALAHEFGTSYPTATRWIQGINAPHPAMRRGVYRTLVENLRLVEKILAVDPKNDSDFYQIIDRFYKMKNWNERGIPELAEIFTVNQATVQLWLDRTNSPHPEVRPAMYKRIIEEIQSPP